VLNAITIHGYPMPILLVADPDAEPPYHLFKGIRGDARHLDPKQPFGHENYTSAYLPRSAGEGNIPGPDASALHEQDATYLLLLDEMREFLSQCNG
jgi:hypothetical protein